MSEHTTEIGHIPTRPNDNAWFAMGLALAPLLMIAYAWWLWGVTGQHAATGGANDILSGRGGAYWASGSLIALTGTYFGVRGHNFAVRGLATNGRMARVWAALGIVVALAMIVSAFTIGTLAVQE